MMMNGKPGPDEWCIPALKTLLSFKPDTELVAYEDKKTALQVAALSQRDAHFIDTLLELGEMDLNARTVEGRTPLSCCVEAGDIGFFMKLVRAGADVMTRDGEGRSLLQNVLDDEFCAWECLPTFLEEGLCTLESNAGDGMTVRQFLKEWRWEYTVEGRVRGIEALD
ncbi:hypothetical protein BJY04DRAFT_201420 [Aspergillus karnatakaensis]|uniref:uncharacterized protein n=1 Tax=Aspergillus karnatakaensis TaxID=1810916 RepID=UPI003CCCE61C